MIKKRIRPLIMKMGEYQLYYSPGYGSVNLYINNNHCIATFPLSNFFLYGYQLLHHFVLDKSGGYGLSRFDIFKEKVKNNCPTFYLPENQND